MQTNSDVVSKEELSKKKLFNKCVIYLSFISYSVFITLFSMYFIEFLKDSFSNILFGDEYNINYIFIIAFYSFIIFFTIGISCDARMRLHKYGNHFEISIVRPLIRLISVIMIFYFVYLCFTNCLNLMPSSHPDLLGFGAT